VESNGEAIIFGTKRIKIFAYTFEDVLYISVKQKTFLPRLLCLSFLLRR